MRNRFEFELVDQAEESEWTLHEALCKAIHEGNEDAWEWLRLNVSDILELEV